jgi:DNA-binding transcriptional LysR family regulator
MNETESIFGAHPLARRLSLDSLRLLSIVVREGSMAAAARTEPLSASAISKRIAALERVMGHSLLQRASERMEPTPEGRLVLEQWWRIERELEPLVASSPATAPLADRDSTSWCAPARY